MVEAAQKRAFARPRRPDDGHLFPLVDVLVDALQDLMALKGFFQVFNVDHLRAAICEVPVKDADYRKQYLVIYDSVPGGTGYLKQLLQHDDALIQIFPCARQKSWYWEEQNPATSSP